MAFIKVENLRLEYPLYGNRRLVPDIRYASLRDLTPQVVGGNFIRSKNREMVLSLDDVSFELHSGDRLGLIGANGAGKSTLLSILGGIYEPSAGRLEIDGTVDALFNIALGFRPEATGRRNIVLRGLINGWSQAEIDTRMPEIIEFSELGEFIDMPYKSYSQGMAARLAFAIATVVAPDILLLDEWIGAGDVAFQKKAQARMNEMVDGAGIMIIASHNYDLLKKTCNKVMHLEKGRILEFGNIADIL